MLDIAERILAEEGLAAVQARRIALEADCSVGTLYNVFGDLNGLIIAINTRTLKALGAALEIAARGAARGSLEDRLLALALAYRDYAVEHGLRWRALFEHLMPPGAEAPQSFVDERSRLLDLIGRCIEDIEPDPERRGTAARALFGAVHGIIKLALDNKLGGAEANETESQVRFIVRHVARGLAGAARQSG